LQIQWREGPGLGEPARGRGGRYENADSPAPTHAVARAYEIYVRTPGRGLAIQHFVATQDLTP
jgi:hypothetical protein